MKVPISYPMEKQTQIIVACMALLNFIRESNIVVTVMRTMFRVKNHPHNDLHIVHTSALDEDRNMNAFLDQLANSLFNR